MNSPVTFSDELTARRQELGISQSAAARQAGVSRGAWRAWESGEAIPQDFNYVRIETVMQWEAGSAELAVLGRRKPVVVRRRIERDQPRDETEVEMVKLIKRGLSEVDVWAAIDERRERLAREVNKGRRGPHSNSA
jgi:transcriptional regulator with XRE-family HTH domain